MEITFNNALAKAFDYTLLSAILFRSIFDCFWYTTKLFLRALAKFLISWIFSLTLKVGANSTILLLATVFVFNYNST